MDHFFYRYYNSSTRPYWHMTFWLLFLLYHTLIIGSFEGRSYQEEFLWEAFDLPVKICTTYLVLYVLLPRYFMQKRIVAFSILFAGSLILAAFLQRLNYYFLVNPFMQPDLPREGLFQLKLNSVLKTVFGIYPVVVLAAFIKVCKHWYERDRESQKLEREKVEAELNFLKAQIHPHFLFNTLNNLYALTLKKSEKASEVVLKLSHLLNYLLYEGNSSLVPLDKELEIMDTYIALEKIRYGDRLEVSCHIQGSSAGRETAPMLLLPFVENSFKHGASQQTEQAWVRIELKIGEKDLHVRVANSKAATPGLQPGQSVPQGIGLKNVSRRLKLLYGNRYTLTIQDRPAFFQVDMRIPLTPVFQPNPATHEAKLLYS